ncbi:Hypothetical predicted protein [Mytilus galloprovincialis]|nr:Hypothetical predicted protein [Mytilus galloprovincialis]
MNAPCKDKDEKENTKNTPRKLIDRNDKSPDFRSLINYLGLDEYYPDKMQVRDVMQIEKSVKDVTFKEIVLMFVRNIIMINLNGRDRCMQEQLMHKSKYETVETPASRNYLENILRIKAKDTNRSINPLDLTVAVFKCASPMLKNTIASKFFTCKLAIPFVFPNNCFEDISLSLIPFHSVVIECTSNGNSINEVSINCPCHVVSFLRFGLLSVSKSKLVNEILNDQYHNTFFDRDCPLGSSNRCISEGLIEAAWYLPSRKSKFLSSVTTFLNLRGDAFRFQEQLRILSNISSVLVILIELNSLGEKITPNILESLLENVYGIVIAIDAYKNTENELFEKMETFLKQTEQYQERVQFCVLKINEAMKGSADIKKEMRDNIRMLVDTKPLSTIWSRLKSSKLKTNEDIGRYRKIQQIVTDLWKLFPERCENIKQQVIPVQGEHWEAWSKNLKTFQNSSKFKSQIEAGIIKKTMFNERSKQAKLCQKINPFMKKFINHLCQIIEIENECHVFIMLVKNLLDDRSRKVLPKFQTRYSSDWRSLKFAKEQKKDETTISELLKRVAQSEKDLYEASFGFEHLCRELGQIFEALSENASVRTNLQEHVEGLPQIAARMLLMGQPFELMDGDVANVPMIWIKAVFRELEQMLDGKKILALSVLGIQSSGKSTLLNTMFGFQFAVSAGRCTRGVYAQLMPVEKTAFPFDYVLVIDTEGLRALELADLKKSHDNELATFVVGLGDITIINVKGENTTEVRDVLQIVVHAFLRLKLANKKSNLKQRCIFAHQNVPAQDANEKMRHGRQKFIEILDMMTKEAAAQERIADIQTFNQVIDLDIEKDIWYFSDLWRGDPPMAPANPGYSETVADVLKAITQKLIVERETYLTISSTVTRIEDLWLGILKDDFVFSFRNCLEFKAYNEIEGRFHSLTWRLEQKVQEFIKADAKSSLMTCDHPDDLDKKIEDIFVNLSNMVLKELEECKEELDSFINNNSLKDVMIQWQQNKLNRLEMFCQELTKQAKTDILDMKNELKVQKKQLTDKIKHRIQINQLAEQIAVTMKGSFPNENVIRQEFNKMWNGWISQFDTQAVNHRNSIQNLIEQFIQTRFPSDVAYMTQYDKSPILSDNDYRSMKRLEKHFSIRHIKDEHFSIHSSYLGLRDKISQRQCKTEIVEIVNVIFFKIDSRLSELKVEDTKFNTSYVSEILNLLCDAYDDHNKHKSNGYYFNLTTAFRACICTHLKRYLVIFFERLDKKYNDKHSPKAVMEEYKETVWKLFTNTVESKTEDVIVVDLFRDTLIKEMFKIILGMMPLDVQSYILTMYPFRKFRLIKDVLTKLAESDDFSSIRLYITEPLAFCTTWIKNITNKTMFETKEDGCTIYAQLAKSRIETLFPKVANAISDANEACKIENCKTFSKWMEYFAQNINKNNIPISKDAMAHVKSRNVSNLDSFIEILQKQLGDIKREVSALFENRSKHNVIWEANPVPKIMNNLWGCSETCMFCKEPCIKTDKDHVNLGQDHECLQHRPQGFGGYNWLETKKLCVEFCNHWIGTDQTYILNRGKKNEETRKYREYKKHYPHWDILHSHDKSQYWMWMMCKFKDQLAKMYSKEQPDIPENWPLITKAQALESLSVYILDDNSHDTEKH